MNTTPGSMAPAPVNPGGAASFGVVIKGEDGTVLLRDHRVVGKGLIWHSSTIASKRDLGHFEPMDEKDSPTPFVRLALRAALYGAGLITIYTALARVIMWFGPAPK